MNRPKRRQMPFVESNVLVRGDERYVIQHKEFGVWIGHAQRHKKDHAFIKARNDYVANGEPVRVYDLKLKRVVYRVG